MIPCVRYSLEDSNTVSLKVPYPMMLIIATRISLQNTQLPKSFNYDRQSAGGRVRVLRLQRREEGNPARVELNAAEQKPNISDPAAPPLGPLIHLLLSYRTCMVCGIPTGRHLHFQHPPLIATLRLPVIHHAWAAPVV